jgi:hypothetical protein
MIGLFSSNDNESSLGRKKNLDIGPLQKESQDIGPLFQPSFKNYVLVQSSQLGKVADAMEMKFYCETDNIGTISLALRVAHLIENGAILLPMLNMWGNQK